MHDIHFIQDLAVVMLVAGLVTVLFHQLKQPVVLGYIIAGAVIGPYTPPFPLIASEDTIRTLAELGVIFLLFSLGLEFSLKKLKAVGITAFIAAMAEIILMLWVGYEIGRMFDWNTMDAIFLGAMLAISSTTIIIKALEELGKKEERFAQLIFGILIVEDILAIAIIALLSGIAQTGEIDATTAFQSIGTLTVFMVATVLIGLLTVPRIIAYVARFHSNEMMLITVLALCFGFCLLVAKLDYSVALGAFLMGAIMAEARELDQIERLIEPVRDMFSAIFFVAIGMLIDPKMLMEYALPIVVITVAVIMGKVITCSLGSFLAGNDGQTSLRVGMGLAQIGEFSFIIASLGLSLQVTSDFLYPIAVAVAAITTLFTPYLIRASDTVTLHGRRLLPGPLLNFMNLYTAWVSRIRIRGDKAILAAVIRRSVWIIIVNLLLITGVFLFFAYLARLELEIMPELVAANEVMEKTLLWSVAVFISLPLFVATFRKIQALSMLLADISIPQGRDGDLSRAARKVLAQAIPVAAVAGFALMVLALSSTLLPPRNVLIVLGILFTFLTLLFWSRFVSIYSKLQIALKETLEKDQESHH